MKSLPTLPLTLSAVLTTGCIWFLLPAAQGQEAESTSTSTTDSGEVAASEAGSATESTPEEATKPPVERRNEKSGASASVTLEGARDKLISYRSIKAQIIETVAIGPRRFRLEGSYLQGTDLRLRLEYDLEVGNTKARLLEVCDGQILWTHQTIGSEEQVTRRNVRQILSAAGSAGHTPQNLLTAELGLGGLPGLLAGIQKSVQFEKQWEQDVNGETFVAIEGGWKKTFRSKFLGPDPADDQPLPPFVPDLVRVYLEQESLFPRRILYAKQDEDGKRRPMVSLDFVSMEVNEPIAEDAFDYTPPEKVARTDVTQAYINRFAPKQEEGGNDSATE